MARLSRHLKATLSTVADFLWPPACGNCGTDTLDPGTLCPDCWQSFDLITVPWCAICGLPFDENPGPDAICGDCASNMPPFDRARSAFAYNDASRGMVLRFKHADRTDLAPLLAQMIMRNGKDLLSEANIITPVPLHRRRLLTRRYNQSVLIARHLGRASETLLIPDLVVRTRRTPPQSGRSRRARYRYVKGAFHVAPRYRAILRDKRVVLVDDVYTTGATVGTVARALLRGGAAGVDVLTIARVLRKGV